MSLTPKMVIEEFLPCPLRSMSLSQPCSSISKKKNSSKVVVCSLLGIFFEKMYSPANIKVLPGLVVDLDDDWNSWATNVFLKPIDLKLLRSVPSKCTKNHLSFAFYQGDSGPLGLTGEGVCKRERGSVHSCLRRYRRKLSSFYPPPRPLTPPSPPCFEERLSQYLRWRRHQL